MSSLGVSPYSWHVGCTSLSYDPAKQVGFPSILEDVRMNSYGIFDSYPASMLISIYCIANKSQLNVSGEWKQIP